MCIYSPMPHTLSYCALIGKCALIRLNTVCRAPDKVGFGENSQILRVAMIREKYLENEFFSRSGKSQGILWMAREI